MSRNVFATPFSSYLTGYLAADDMLRQNKELKSRLQSEELNRRLSEQAYRLNEELNPLKISAARNANNLNLYMHGDEGALPANAPIVRDAMAGILQKEFGASQLELDDAANRYAQFGDPSGYVQMFARRRMQAVPSSDGLTITSADGSTSFLKWEDLARGNPVYFSRALDIAKTRDRPSSSMGMPTISSFFGIGGVPQSTNQTLNETANQPSNELTAPPNSRGSSPKQNSRVPELSRQIDNYFLKFYGTTLNDGSNNLTTEDVDKWSPFIRQSNNQQNSFNPDYLKKAIISIESSGNPNAVSPKGAIGLMQVKPTTAMNPGFYEYGARDVFSVADELGIPYSARTEQEAARLLFIPEINERVGWSYFTALLNRFGSINEALAAYNMGAGNLQEHLRRNGGLNLDKLPRETREYIPKALAALNDIIRSEESNALTAY